MSSEDLNALNAKKVEVLRSLGHTEAADVLAEMHQEDAERREKFEAAREREQQQRAAGLPGVPLLSHDPGRRQAEEEGRVVAERLRASGVGKSWATAGSLFSDDGRPNR